MNFFSKIKNELSLIPGTVQNLLGIGERKSTIVETWKSGVGKIAEWTPGEDLARGLGIASTLNRQQEEQEKLDRRQQRLQNELVNRLDEAKREKDEERYNRLKNIAQKTANEDIEIITDKVLKDAPSNRQVIASAGELGLTAVIGLKPGVKTTGRLVSGRAAKLAQQTRRIRNIEALKNMTGIGAKRAKAVSKIGDIARESLIGSAFFAAIKAQEEDASTEDIVRSAELGGAIGAGGVVGAGLIGKGIEKISPRIGRFVRRGVRRIEEVAAGEPIGKTQINKTLSTIGQRKTPKQFTASALLKGIQAARQFKAAWIDRFSPIQRIEDALIDLKGGSLTEEEKIYRDIRLLTSTADTQAENWVVQLGNDLRPYNDIDDKLKAYLLQLDYLDRAKLATGKVPGGQTEQQLKNGLRRIINEIGPADMERVGRARQIIRGYHRTRLQDRVNAGLITQEQMDAMMKAHPNYIPHNVIMDMDEKSLGFISDSYNVSKTDLMKAVGSVRDIEDPFVAMGQRAIIGARTIEKNKLLNNLIKAQEKYNVMPGAKKISANIKPEKHFDKIHLFRNGKKEVWQVSKDVAVAVKNTDAPVNSKLFTLFTYPAKILRRFATRYNLSFAVPNKARDKQTAILTADAFIEDLAKRYGLSREGFKPISKSHLSKEVRKLYKESGGFGASIFEEGEERVWKKVRKIGIQKYKENIKPHKLLENVNDAFEQETRLEVFKKALDSGLSPKDAALVSRDATIDFAKMGYWMRQLNQAVPFLNARVQGFINLPRAMKASPETFARMQLYSAVYPTMALHSHNRRYKSYDNVGQYFKNRYWIIMTGETETTDEYSGKKILVPHFITLPKGEGQVLVSSPIQWWLDKQDKRDFRKTNEMLADTIGSASPLEFQSFDQANWWSTMISQLGPVATIPFGLASNMHPYFGRQVVPEKRKKAEPALQFRKTTPEVIKNLGEIMRVAPAKIEFILNSFGGLTRDLQESADIIFGLVKREDLKETLKEESISETDFGLGSRFPIARRFMREAREFYSPESEFRKRQREEIEEELESEKIRVYDKADDIWEEMNEKESPEEKLNYLNSLGNELTPEIRKRLLYLKNNRESVDILNKHDSVELRARYIQLRLDEMEHSGISGEERLEYLNNLENTGILTKKVKKMILIIQRQD